MKDLQERSARIFYDNVGRKWKYRFDSLLLLNGITM